MEQKKENTRKETGTIRGTVRRYSDQSFEFTPFGKGEPVYQEQHKYKNGVTVATTRGANPKQVVRLEVAADAPDLYHACVEKLDEALPAATAAAQRKKRALHTLMNEGGASVTLDEATGLIRMEAEISVIFAAPLKRIPLRCPKQAHWAGFVRYDVKAFSLSQSAAVTEIMCNFAAR